MSKRQGDGIIGSRIKTWLPGRQKAMITWECFQGNLGVMWGLGRGEEHARTKEALRLNRYKQIRFPQ